MKTKTIFAGCLALACVQITKAQNASEYNNNAPINGINSAAFGVKALAANLSTDANNSALGFTALYNNAGGSDNTASGAEAMYYNITGNNNSAHGRYALFNNLSGNDNTASGHSALFSNTIGNYNTAFGRAALYFNNSDHNSAFGDSALYSNTGGGDNAAFGNSALKSNIVGAANTAVGALALSLNNASYNTALGAACLVSNTSGFNNTSTGAFALNSNISGFSNTANGYLSLTGNIIGTNNTCVGSYAAAQSDGFGNTCIGFHALYNNLTGNLNTAVGYAADVSTGGLINATAIGRTAIVNASHKVRIGGVVTVVEGPVAYTISDGRFKTNIKNDDVKGLEFIKKLRPVVYNFDTKKFTEFLTKEMTAEQRKEYMNEDFKPSTDIRQSGFIAQEVEQAAKEVGYDFNGVHKPVNDNDNYSLAYSQFVVPLIKAVQEQQAMIETQISEINNLKKEIAELHNGQNAVGSQQSTGLALAAGSGHVAGTDGFDMQQNIPNPFTHETVIKYNLPASVNTAYMAVYDLSGKQLTTFALSQKGNASLTITTEKLAPGIYIYSIVADGRIMDSKRMVVADK